MHKVDISRNGQIVAYVEYQGIPVLQPDGSYVEQVRGGARVPYAKNVATFAGASLDEMNRIADRIAEDIGRNLAVGEIDGFNWKLQ